MLKRLVGYLFLFGLIAASTICLVLDSKKNTALTPPTLVEATQAHTQSWQDTLQAIGSLSASQGCLLYTSDAADD